MPNKSFSIYRSEDYRAEEGDQLVLEIANSHMACVVIKAGKKSITAFEVFSFKTVEAQDIDKLLDRAIQDSKILTRPPSSVTVYINNEFCLPVPIFQFTREIAIEYLNLAFGEDGNSKVQFEHLPVEPGIINVYRIRDSLREAFQKRFQNCTFHHTYSNIIRMRLNEADLSIPELINVQFYNTFFIVAVLKAGQLQFIQTFVYEAPEDVLYYLLNICQQMDLDQESLTMQISGMIDVHYKLYRELITYFKKVQVQSVDESKSIPDTGEYPLHYFTPYFNLAL